MKHYIFILLLIFLFSGTSLASEFHSKDDYKQARKAYTKLIKKYPNNWIFYYNRGMLLYEQGNPYVDGAYKDFQKASELNPESEELKYNYLVIKEYRDRRLNYALKAVGIGGVVGGVVMNSGLPHDIPKLKPLDTKVWETLENTELQNQ